MNPRRYDIVLYGATGFVGCRAAAYLARHPQRAEFRWAIAGRDPRKLRTLQNRLASEGAQVDLLVAGSRDHFALSAITAATRVVINTAGPYRTSGDALVAACVRDRTHYVDITGETLWVHTLIEQHHGRAAANGTRIIPCCGFDAVPSDLGCFLVARQLQQAIGRSCVAVSAYFQMSGGLNGGTVATALDQHAAGPARRRRDPFLLNPQDAGTPRDRAVDRDPTGVRYDRRVGAWVAPFIMGPINTRVVRRSAALFEQWQQPYGKDFQYQEYAKYDPPFAPLKALLANTVRRAFERGLAFAGTRAALAALLPAPGRGPSEHAMAAGWFTTELLACTADGRRMVGLIRHQGDPGNLATRKFVCEAALALALDAARLPGAPTRGGVLTPATGLGDVLAERLRAADTTFEFRAQERPARRR
jgi:short subunit dehydrogenase-like uncharacterized protein